MAQVTTGAVIRQTTQSIAYDDRVRMVGPHPCFIVRQQSDSWRHRARSECFIINIDSAVSIDRSVTMPVVVFIHFFRADLVASGARLVSSDTTGSRHQARHSPDASMADRCSALTTSLCPVIVGSWLSAEPVHAFTHVFSSAIVCIPTLRMHRHGIV